ncbi:alkyl sulfatase dimerization domain-containing protein [Nonomuraea dietziae]|uniref:Glyoxylase-like metal-dependent hydrolase (Beta-lactamase superfamily II) n=1 Tax=Nonomuraea dietziae TaxID=65515 RepID=A0A7W5VGJ2_9ACTN|nr:alkyl sulfatase dimerization domain-containing protein [Nonomuraea dietziae]MBB3731164.1 glyoxylase-like metal-dependent hydrolase (beta-lactamase superfamily II) [Nonomuraea dietziae]
MIEEYADRVWRGEEADSIVDNGMDGKGVQQIADGLGWWPGFGNVIAFETEGELVLFDTSSGFSAARMHQDVRAWSGAPLTTAFFSHGHFDHVYGLGPFEQEGRRATVYAHEAVGARFDRYILTNGYNAVINQRQFQAPNLRWPSDYRYPDVTYRDSLTVHRGDLTFELFHAKGETDDATVGHVPEHRLLLPGDLFIWVTPNCGNPQKVQRYPREWVHALRRMASLDAEIMLPSHGAPVFGADRVRQALLETAEWLEHLVTQTLDLLNAGARLDEIVHTVRPLDRYADRPYLRARYDEPEFVVRNIWRLYGGWYDGNPAHLKPAPDAVLASAVAELAGGPAVLADAALKALGEGDERLAGHLAEMAALAAPGDAGVHRVRAEVFGTRAAGEMSLMSKGIFTWAASESSKIAGA